MLVSRQLGLAAVVYAVPVAGMFGHGRHGTRKAAPGSTHLKFARYQLSAPCSAPGYSDACIRVWGV